jgi:glutathione peroxidase-family protein
LAQGQSRLSLPVLDSLGKVSKLDTRKYDGYKFLLVNVDPQDSSFRQFGDIVTLSSRVNKCIIIVFPLNCSSLSREELHRYFSSHFRSANLLISEPESENAKQNSVINKWLARRSENGHIDFRFTQAMQKVLIGPKGNLEAIFGPQMRPLDANLIQAISR